jgi:hypothetical protein
VTPLTSLVASTELSRSRFEEAPLRDANASQTVFGADFAANAILSGAIRVGFQSLNPRSEELPQFTGMVGNANVVYRLGPLTSLVGRYDRSIAYSYFEEEPYYVRHSFGGGVVRQLSRDWDVQLGADRTWHDYRRAGVSSENPAGHGDRLVGATLAAGYQIGPRTRISSGLSFFDRQSDFAYRSYRGWRVGTSLFYGF